MSSTSTPLQLAVIDVGHGNCTVARDGKESLVVDIPHGVRLADSLQEQGCTKVRNLVLSHADKDHIGGATQLLSDKQVEVEKLWLNPDVEKHSETFIDLLTLAYERFKQGALKFTTNLNIAATGELDFGRVSVEVLHPNIVRAGIGQASKSNPLGAMSSNGMSAVLRVSLSGHPCALLPGDVDDRGFQEMTKGSIDLTAEVFVFPHHGGHANSVNDEEFARLFCSLVSPKVVVFSMGRMKFQNPRPEIVRGVRRGAPNAHVACTQLSRLCHKTDLSDEKTQAPTLPGAVSWPSAGSKKRLCCAGTVVIDVEGDQISYRPDRMVHLEFIKEYVSAPQCLS